MAIDEDYRFAVVHRGDSACHGGSSHNANRVTYPAKIKSREDSVLP